MNDDRNEIDESDLNPTTQETERWGVPVVEHRIRWEPNINQMCDDYDLDERVCDHDRDSSERTEAKFTFSLICKVEQENMYQQENANQEAVVSHSVDRI